MLQSSGMTLRAQPNTYEPTGSQEKRPPRGAATVRAVPPRSLQWKDSPPQLRVSNAGWGSCPAPNTYRASIARRLLAASRSCQQRAQRLHLQESRPRNTSVPSCRLIQKGWVFESQLSRGSGEGRDDERIHSYVSGPGGCPIKRKGCCYVHDDPALRSEAQLSVFGSWSHQRCRSS